MKLHRSLIPFFLFSFFAYDSFSQPNFQWDNSIPVQAGTPLPNAWAGGLNFVQVCNFDLDQDGKKDVVTFDKSGNKLRTFINNGTTGAVDLTYAPQYEAAFPYLHDWALFADYDGDSKEDIFSFSDVGVGVKVYKNISSIASGLQFMLIEDLLQSKQTPPSPTLSTLIITPVDIPALCDIDNDSDLDIVTFGNSSTYIFYHQNQSFEMYGHNDSLIFEIKNKCWGYASEDAMSNTFTLNDTCIGNVSAPELPVNETDLRAGDRHSGGTELCLDLDGDGDKEIVVGDISYNSLTMLTNDGTPTDGHFSAIDIAFPANSASTSAVALTTFPAAYYTDVNFDGARDLIVSPNAPNYSENAHSVLFYKNTGTDASPDFEFEQNDLLQDSMIEVGEGAYPCFYDYDNDGLKDMFIGNYGYYGASAFQPKVAQFKNTGTLTAPSFNLVTNDFMNLSSLNILNMVPSFGDLDGDTDADMIIGGYDGKLHYFENTAAIGSPANFTLTAANFKNAANRTIDVGDCAAPQIVDVDGDGKNDVLIGGRTGKIAYYHHIGTGTTAIPSMDSVSHFFGNVKVNRPGYFIGYSYPFLFKQGGVSRLLVGAESGYLQMYDSIDGNLGGTFARTDTTYNSIFQGTRTAPYGTDMNNDGLMDLIVGNYAGGVSFYRGVSSSMFVDNSEYIHFNFDLFPNPTTEDVSIRILNGEHKNYTVELYDLTGRTIAAKKIENNLITIDVSEFARGIYICKVTGFESNGKLIGTQTKKIVLH